MFSPRGLKLSEVKNETLAGFVVAVSMIPEAVGFSLVAGLSPIVGLHTAFIIGLMERSARRLAGRGGTIGIDDLS